MSSRPDNYSKKQEISHWNYPIRETHLASNAVTILQHCETALNLLFELAKIDSQFSANLTHDDHTRFDDNPKLFGFNPFVSFEQIQTLLSYVKRHTQSFQIPLYNMSARKTANTICKLCQDLKNEIASLEAIDKKLGASGQHMAPLHDTSVAYYPFNDKQATYNEAMHTLGHIHAMVREARFLVNHEELPKWSLFSETQFRNKSLLTAKSWGTI